MSVMYSQLCALLLQEYYGTVVESVIEKLVRWGPQTLTNLQQKCNLSAEKVKEALSVAIQHNIVTYISDEYNAHPERIYLLIRYPRYLMTIKSLYGDEAEILIEELLRNGRGFASHIIFHACLRLNEALEAEKKTASVSLLNEKFVQLTENRYIQRCPVNNVLERDLYTIPKLNLNALNERLIAKLNNVGECSDSTVYWRVNFDRFHQDFRDQLMVTAITNCIDENAGQLLKIMLQLMYERTDAWAATSNPIPITEIREYIKRLTNLPYLLQYLDQYLKIMDEDSAQFVKKVSDAGGGQYTVNVKAAFTELSWVALESIVLERFGAKAARIFRLVKMKQYVEIEQLQELGMIPVKEAKSYAFQLLQENFLQLQELRKSLNNTGPNKPFFLFHIDHNMVVRMVLENTYKSLQNVIIRREHEKLQNKWLIEKQQRIDSLSLSLQEQDATEAQVAEIESMLTPPERLVLQKVRSTSAKLSCAEMQLDDTIFLLQMYLYYKQTSM